MLNKKWSGLLLISLLVLTGQSGVYAFVFGQKGLMAGLGLQGSKITRIFSELKSNF